MEPNEERREMEAETVKNMDVDLSKRFFNQMSRNEEFTSLNIPPINIPKTLVSSFGLVGLCFGNRNCSSDVGLPLASSSSGESESLSNNSSPKEWSELFAEDGRLCFEQILPLCNSSPEMSRSEEELYVQTLDCAKLALSSYNQKNKGTEYELVAPLLSNTLYHREYYYVDHANFLAKPKNTDSPPELFFAELVAYSPYLFEEPVLKCCILTPQLCGSSLDAMTSAPISIFHPQDYNYMYCELQAIYDSDSDDDC